MKTRDEQFPLFPLLSDGGKREAQELVDQFKAQLIKAADAAIGDLYCDVAVHIESDSWTNYRNKLMEGFRDYNNRLVQNEFDFREIRQQIYRDFRDEIIDDLNQDNLKRIKALEEELAALRKWFSR
jgi:hypothetical protein